MVSIVSFGRGEGKQGNFAESVKKQSDSVL